MSTFQNTLKRLKRAAMPLFALALAFGLTACLTDTGQPCSSDEDCVLGTLCLTEADGFPGGYCTTENCDVNGCSDISTECFSLPISGTNKAVCLQKCDGSGECSRDQYGCYDLEGTPVCLPDNGAGSSRPKSGEVGSGCTDDAQCDESLCLQNLDGGYCSKLCATDSECSSGSHCEIVGSQGFCYRDCANNDECRIGYECNTTDAVEPSCLPSDGRVIKNPNGSDDGQTCVADINCKGGNCLREVEGYPGGYCASLNCNTDDECNGGVCTVQSSNTVCRTACPAGTCRSGYECVSATQPDGSSINVCDNPSAAGGTPSGGSISEFKTGCGSSSSIQFDIAPGSKGFFVAPYTENGSQISPISISGDNGVNLNLLTEYDFYSLNKDILVSIAPFLFPGSDEARFEGGRTDWGGSYTMRFSGSSNVCYYIIESPQEGQTLDVNFYLVDVPGVTAANAGTNSNFQSMLGSVRDIYGNANINIGTVRYFDITGSNKSSYSIIRDFNDVFRLTALTQNPGPSVNERLSVNVFLIRDFDIPEVPGLLGISPGLPGIAGLHQTTASGLIFSSINISNSPADLGQTMAHEIGHYLGLRHTSEHGGSDWDPISDTPECSDPQKSTGCQDHTNFMFPFSINGVRQQGVTTGQTFVLKRSALVK